jgi:hypothetical protein
MPWPEIDSRQSQVKTAAQELQLRRCSAKRLPALSALCCSNPEQHKCQGGVPDMLSPCPWVHRPAAGAVCGQPVPEHQCIVLHHGQYHSGMLLDGCNMEGCGAPRHDQPPA